MTGFGVFPPIFCDCWLTWFVLLAKSQLCCSLSLSLVFSFQRSANNRHQSLPASDTTFLLFPLNLSLQVCLNQKQKLKKRIFFTAIFYFFVCVVLVALKSIFSKGSKQWSSNTSDCQKLQNLGVCHHPCCPWVGCVLSPTLPGHSACLLPLPLSLPDWCWAARMISSTILLL